MRPKSADRSAACCTVLSVFGVVILFGEQTAVVEAASRLLLIWTAFGALFARHAEALAGYEESPKDPGYVARLCYIAGFVYLGFVGFCGLQVS